MALRSDIQSAPIGVHTLLFPDHHTPDGTLDYVEGPGSAPPFLCCSQAHPVWQILECRPYLKYKLKSKLITETLPWISSIRKGRNHKGSCLETWQASLSQ